MRWLICVLSLIPAVSFAGVTIHYSGTLAPGVNPKAAVEMAANYAERHRWCYEVDASGVTIFPHEWCEPLHLSFAGQALQEDFVKTQFAGAEVHIQVVQLLRAINSLFSEVKIVDEGEYWVTKDRAKLEANIEAVNLMIEQIKKAHP